MANNWKMNEKQTALVNLLADGKVRTLAEASAELGFELKTGTTNPLLVDSGKGYIKKVGVKRVPVMSYKEVAVYGIVRNVDGTPYESVDTEPTEA